MSFIDCPHPFFFYTRASSPRKKCAGSFSIFSWYLPAQALLPSLIGSRRLLSSVIREAENSTLVENSQRGKRQCCKSDNHSRATT